MGRGPGKGRAGECLLSPPTPGPGGWGLAPSFSPQLLLSQLTSPGRQTGRQRLRLPKSESAREATAMPRAFGVLLALLLSGGLGGGQAQRPEPPPQQHRRQPPAHQQRGTVEAAAPGHTLCRGPRPFSGPFVLRLLERDRFLALPWGARFGARGSKFDASSLLAPRVHPPSASLPPKKTERFHLPCVSGSTCSH